MLVFIYSIKRAESNRPYRKRGFRMKRKEEDVVGERNKSTKMKNKKKY